MNLSLTILSSLCYFAITIKAAPPNGCPSAIANYKSSIQGSPGLALGSDALLAAFKPGSPDLATLEKMEKFRVAAERLGGELEEMITKDAQFDNAHVKRRIADVPTITFAIQSFIEEYLGTANSNQTVEKENLEKLWTWKVYTDRVLRYALKEYCGWSSQ